MSPTLRKWIIVLILTIILVIVAALSYWMQQNKLIGIVLTGGL